MAQISPPFRIALVAIALLGAVWFVALRPKPDAGSDAPLPAAPGVTGLSNATAKAEATAKAADASAARAEAAAAAADGTSAAQKTTVTKTPSGEAAVTKSTKVKPAKPATPVNPAAPLLAALKRGQVVVLLFRNASSDSASVATMVRSIGERRKVVARVVSIKDVGKYSTFTSATPVAQAPTTMVIGPKRNAVLIVGFTSPGEIAQAVADVRRAGK
jgi:hypothetical protein